MKTELIFLARILIAAVCGLIIGYERNYRGKGASVRTHIIVALASALMMVISKYGFSDMSVGFDPSRIAASIVTGIGFLGAGTIFIQKRTVSGLTTAAGIWATSGIGMAIGSGMYITGVASTLLILLIQLLFHSNLRFLKIRNETEIIITAADCEKSHEEIREFCKERAVRIINTEISKKENGAVQINIFASVPSGFRADEIMSLLSENITSARI